jgi:hypothetical protein
VSGYPVWPAWNTSNPNGVGTNFVFDGDGDGTNATSYVELDDFRLAQTTYINTLWQTQLNY